MSNAAASSLFNPSSGERLDLNFFSEELMIVVQPANLSFLYIVHAMSRHPRHHTPLMSGHRR
jgi:hypothetical protein